MITLGGIAVPGSEWKGNPRAAAAPASAEAAASVAIPAAKAIGASKPDWALVRSEREITVTGNLKNLTNGSLELKAAWVVALNDYKIDIPKLVFYELAAEQQVSIEAILNPKK